MSEGVEKESMKRSRSGLKGMVALTTLFAAADAAQAGSEDLHHASEVNVVAETLAERGVEDSATRVIDAMQVLNFHTMYEARGRVEALLDALNDSYDEETDTFSHERAVEYRQALIQAQAMATDILAKVEADPGLKAIVAELDEKPVVFYPGEELQTFLESVESDLDILGDINLRE